MSTKEAMDHLRETLKGPEYRYGWQANIAMAFYDHVRRSPEFSRNEPMTHDRLHELANGAAIALLEQLSPMREVPDLPGAMVVSMIHEQAAKDASIPDHP